ncbi:MAG: hypothetical protein AAF988_08520 [Pseudomonadota bacterium]
MYNLLVIPLTVVGAFILSACAYDIKAENKAATAIETQAITASNLNIALETSDTLDQEAMNLGIACSAHKYKMRLSEDLNERFTALDKDGSLNNTSAADVKVVASTSRSTVKCIQKSSVSGICEGEVQISGKTVSKSGIAKPFAITKKSSASTVSCGGAKKSLAQASNDAISDLVEIVQSYN